MNLNLFNDIDGLVLRESYPEVEEMTQNNDTMSRFPAKTPLAMAYVPFQQWGETYDSDKAMECGTLFKELVFPFEKGGRS